MVKKPAKRLHFKQVGDAGANIFADEHLIAEIIDLKLTHLCFQPGGPATIGQEVPMPLYWWQYADHEDPDRNTGNNPLLSPLVRQNNIIALKCTGMNRSGSAKSEYRVTFSYSENHRCIVLHVNAKLLIPQGRNWLITPNPDHGEIEFCNLWPIESFGNEPNFRKRYQSCYVQSRDIIKSIPHHHLETRDKKNIALNTNDRFMWLLEDVNPVIELLSSQTVHSGVCAYMWDAHFGYRICNGRKDVNIAGEASYSAEFQLYGIDRSKALEITRSAAPLDLSETDDIPIHTNGCNTFSKRLRDFKGNEYRLWPWIFETDGDLLVYGTGHLVRDKGYRDKHSLKIENLKPTKSQWTLTALGPAYGGDTFADGVKLKLSAWISTVRIQGSTDIAFRLHRSGCRDVLQVDNYEIFSSKQSLCGTNDWQYMEIITPPISPAPDRVHLLLRQSGTGKSWFDDVMFETV